MSIHAEAQHLESVNYPHGRTADDGLWFGSGARALSFSRQLVGRPGKTRRDRLSGSWSNRLANRAARSERYRRKAG